MLAAVAGVVAIGVAGCGSGSDSAKKTDSVEQAAAGVGTSPTAASSSSPEAPATSSLPSTPAPTPTPTSAATSSSPARPSSSASTSAPPSTSKSTTSKPSAPSSSKPTTKPTTPAPTGGTGWLAGVPYGHNTPGALDPRCMTGRVVCIDMSTRTLLWVVDGKPQYGMDVRFGDENNPTRKGKFDIYMKMKNCVSTIYHTPMPDAMFFSGGEAVHFSIDFATYGYAHHSHGCVNVRDRAAVERLFADTRVGDTVVVY
ncbi:MAG: L,D-transpeptidase [Catenulispora sp.]|nr:L,D-transpeptidase [Catenulispora sp.]